MAFYVIERTIKKRRGCYSESDIHISPCHLESRNYYARYNFSDVKNINIPETTKHVINSFEAYYLAGGEYNEKIIIKDCTIRQDTTIELIPDPIIFISNDLGYISYAQSINYKITDSDPTTRFKIVYKLNDVVIGEKYNTTDSNYTIDLTEEHLSKLSFNSRNNITIELSTNDGGVFLTKIVSFTKGNTKPKLNINSYDSTSAKFTVIDTDNNLTKIEWYLDDVLKETITTDLTVEKTINYELTDNAIHTLKIVATDAENATAEKVLSISKEIMPLQEDANLSDISTKLIEIGEGFRNGKTSIINTLALKNIEASLNNTLVELSEKIKISFDSSDASVQDLMNQLTQANNTISQLNSKYKYATGTAYARENSSLIACVYDPNTSHTVTETSPYWLDLNGIGFIPDIFFAECEYEPHSNAFYKYFVFAIKNTFPISNNTGFVVNIAFNKEYGDESFKLRGALYTLGKRHVSMDNNGVRVPSLSTLNDFRAYKWHAIKFK
ncbi:Uncharacterised protein [Clostridioides difficile]|uniref:hypothetical protein n=1 Tax=Clostridioides difficile TaxID=1496 RepID=UPI00093D1334|nr:hypothetical protein [Clostridioides difficile]VHX56126.1 Uncharacterised protein [Clostridioides difficile]HBF2284529.1 hypothetical protein [Clostridioides difficile]HBF5708962.1 hypothetical protein [Clostridioides difficile]HBF6677489.1 hypothetical protein [Clostridioides difficile]HBF8116097.1 hypothetical protein [Clostridioides difficile]